MADGGVTNALKFPLLEKKQNNLKEKLVVGETYHLPPIILEEKQ